MFRSFRRSYVLVALAMVGTALPLLLPNAAQATQCASRGNPNGSTGNQFSQFDIQASGDDGRVFGKSHSHYPPAVQHSITGAQSLLTARSYYTMAHPPYYHIGNSLMRWDTSSLPDGANIVSATICVTVNKVFDADNRDLTADWYSPDNWPINNADYSKTAQTTALGGEPLSNFSPGTALIHLDNTTGVSTTGFTGIRLHVSGGKPTGKNYLRMGSGDTDGSGPTLYIVYNQAP